MAGSSQMTCRRCGATIRVEETFCPTCLLAIADSTSEEEHIFQQALALDRSERLGFIQEATRGKAALLEAVLMLLQGYEETGEGAGQTSPGDPGAKSHAEQPGLIIDHFRLLSLIGEGGMGSVWKAEQTAPVKRMVAIKVIKLGMDTREVVKRFGRERQTLALLNHSNIAQVFEAGATALGRPYFAMELVEGQAITTYCETANLGVEVRLKLFQEVCAAIEHAHQKGIIHRDLKPSNILVANGAVKVIDFGVAKATQRIGHTPLFTRQAQILGTPAYMSPEQAQTAGLDIDTRTDIYSLGVVLYELLTGSLPIDPARLARTSIAEMQRILLEEEPPAPSTLLTDTRPAGQSIATPGVPRRSLRGDLDWVVMKAIRKDRNERYSSAAAFSEDLQRYLAGELVSAVPPTLTYRVRKFVQRHRAGVTAAALILATMVAGTAVSLREAVQASRAQQVATRTLADMYARSGLGAAEAGDPSRAALWFANAAIISGGDAQRAEANAARAAAWSRTVMAPVRAREVPISNPESLLWNPRRPAIIINAAGMAGAVIWDLETDRLWNPGFPGPLKHAIWDARGDRVVSICGGDLICFEYGTGQEKARLGATVPQSLAFSPKNDLLAVGTDSPFLWNLETGQRLPLAVKGQSPSALRFSKDGARLLLQWGTHAGICSVTNPATFLHHPVPNSLGGQPGFLGDGRLYFTAGPEGETLVRDTRTGEIVETYAHSIFIPRGFPVTASPDGRFIARSNGPGIDRVSRAEAGFPVHDNVMSAVFFGPDGGWFASAGADGKAKLWTLPEGKFAGEIGHHQADVHSIAISCDSTLVASAEGNLVRIWRLAIPPVGRSIPLAAPSLVTVSPDGRLLAPSGWTIQGYAGTDRTRAIDIASGDGVGPDLVTGGTIMGAAFSPDSAWLAVVVTTTRDRQGADLAKEPGTGNLQFWDYQTGRLLGERVELPSEPRAVAIHPSGKWVGICCNGGKGVEVEVSTRKLRILFDGQNYTHSRQTLNNGRCAYSPDGRLFVLYGSPPLTHLWSREDGRELVNPNEITGLSFDVAFSKDTIGIALLDRQPRLEFRSLGTGALAAPAIAYSGWPFLGRFNASGQLFLSTGRNRIGEVWNWRTGQRICPALTHEGEVMAGTFIPGRPWVATGGHDGMIKLWDYRSGMLMAPPIHREDWVINLQVALAGQALVASRPLAGVEVIDLAAVLPASHLTREDARLLAQINAGAQVHPGGDLVPLSTEEWLQRWRAFRRRNPQYPGHRIPLDPARQKAWHRTRAQELDRVNPAAAGWHRRRAVLGSP